MRYASRMARVAKMSRIGYLRTTEQLFR